MYPLKNRHSFAIDVFAKQLTEIRSLADLALINWSNNTYILGEGTNTIFTENFEGQLLLNRLTGIEIEETPEGWHVFAAAGENWHQLVVSLIELGIYGSENLALIPGSVGAAPVQNIGAYGVEVARFIDRVDVYDCKLHLETSLTHEECQFSYRDSLFKNPDHRQWLIIGVHFFFPKAWLPVLDYPDLATLPADATAKEIMAHVIQVRQRKLPDPQIVPNAGSFFKNPVVSNEQCQELRRKFPLMPYYQQPDGRCKVAAGWLIDQAGLKSYTVGGAGVHSQQALVLVNREHASGQDILHLAEGIQAQVKARYGIQLEAEVRLLNGTGLLNP